MVVAGQLIYNKCRAGEDIPDSPLQSFTEDLWQSWKQTMLEVMEEFDYPENMEVAARVKDAMDTVEVEFSGVNMVE